MSTDWHAWFEQYDDPRSSLSRRLGVVREQADRVLAELAVRPVTVLSICAGDGRDLLPVLAARAPDAHAVLVELDPALAAAARVAAGDAELVGVEVRTADAGDPTTYGGLPPADLLLACGVFGNVSDADVERTVAALPRLLAPGGRVVWTRGARVEPDPSEAVGDAAQWVRGVFAAADYDEEAFVVPDDASFRVGVHRRPDVAPSAHVTDRLFSFVR